MPAAVITALLHHAQHSPDRPALHDRGQSVSYAELAQQVCDQAVRLQTLGLAPGAHLAIWAHKHPDTVIAMLAGLYAGLVLVPIAPPLRPNQARHICSQSQADAILIDQAHYHWLQSDTPVADRDGLLIAHHLDGPFSVLADRPSGPMAATPSLIEPSATAILFYTSGSTGLPKGVMVTHANLAAGARAVSHYLGLTADDRLLGVLPLSFDYGFSQLSTALYCGACLHLSDYLLPKDLQRPLLDEAVTVVAGTPGLLIPLARQPWLADAPALRIMTNSGGRLPVASVRAIRSARPRTQLFLMYGLTEAFRASFLPPDEVDAHPDSMGRSFAETQLGIIDEHGHLLPPGQTGELVQGGPLVTAGYFNDPTGTAARFRQPPTGWPDPSETRVVYSGDRVHMDESGRLYFRGRLDDQIKTAGFRVSPEEIESVALGCPGVAEALAYPILDDVLGARIGLAVAPLEADEAELRRRLRTELAPYQQPARLTRLMSLPRSANGKLDRQTLMAQFSDEQARQDDQPAPRPPERSA